MQSELGVKFRSETLTDPRERVKLLADLGKIAAEYGVELAPNNRFDTLIVTPDDQWEHDPRGLTLQDFNRLKPEIDDHPDKGSISRAYTVALREAGRNRTLVLDEEAAFIPRSLLESYVSGEIRRPIGMAAQALEIYEAVLVSSRPATPSRQ